jgi:cholest-4-en-3-one 26-monooxygenase
VFTTRTASTSPATPTPLGSAAAAPTTACELARLEIDLMFGAIADHLPGIAAAGPPTRLRSGWLNGITAFPVRYR